MTRAYYSNTIKNFLIDSNDTILGQLARHHNYALEDLQRNAWLAQIDILKVSLQNLKDGYVFFEFAIPRMGKRVDNIVIVDDSIFVIEFKVGSSTYDNYATEQVLDYSLDLKNFHQGSHHIKLFPMLIATQAENIDNKIEILQDLLFQPVYVNKNNITENIYSCLSYGHGENINPNVWENSIYKPTPTIIEAAQALYKGHNVREISRSDSGAINLSITTNEINNIIEQSKRDGKKSICFITGVPGAGKTLAGLNIANERMNIDEDEHAVFYLVMVHWLMY